MPSLTDIEGIGPSLAAACVKSNYRSIAKIAAAKPKELAIVPGITEKGARPIIASAKLLVNRTQLRKTTAIKKQGSVAPLRPGPKTVSATQKVKKKKRSISKARTDDKNEDKTMADSRLKKKIKKLNKKIKKLKKERKKIKAKDKKSKKDGSGKKSGKKK